VRLLERALTHRSFGATHNERLEFLGDAVLNLAVGQLLYLALDAQDEGSLSRARANLVRQGTLHKLALDLDLAPLLRLGEGEARSGGAKRASILADAVEAIIGAVYLDAGFEAAHGLVQRLFKDVNFSPDMAAMGKDPKTALQEWLQGKKLALPGYSVAQIAGVQHAQTFEVLCEVPSLSLRSVGSGVSRRAAEQAAAAAMLQLLPQQ
jgi:ribonuclease-3